MLNLCLGRRRLPPSGQRHLPCAAADGLNRLPGRHVLRHPHRPRRLNLAHNTARSWPRLNRLGHPRRLQPHLPSHPTSRPHLIGVVTDRVLVACRALQEQAGRSGEAFHDAPQRARIVRRYQPIFPGQDSGVCREIDQYRQGLAGLVVDADDADFVIREAVGVRRQHGMARLPRQAAVAVHHRMPTASPYARGAQRAPGRQTGARQPVGQAGQVGRYHLGSALEPRRRQAGPGVVVGGRQPDVIGPHAGERRNAAARFRQGGAVGRVQQLPLRQHDGLLAVGGGQGRTSQRQIDPLCALVGLRGPVAMCDANGRGDVAARNPDSQVGFHGRS